MRRSRIAVGVLLLGVAGCSSMTAEDRFCRAEEDLLDSLETVSELTLESDSGEIQSARDEVARAWPEYREAAEDHVETRLAGLESAYSGFDAAVDAIEGDSPQETVQTALVAADAFWAEVNETRIAVACS